jgi:DNA-binding transcriptional LysR family regulator
LVDRLGAMSVFLQVVASGSLSAASRELAMPLPTVSRRISELEAHLHAKLLVRSTRRLALTEVGKAYAAACQRILSDVAEAERIAAGQYEAPQGELIVTAPIVFGRRHVVPLTAEFLRENAQVDVRLVLTDRNLNLIEDEQDLAVRIGLLPDSRLVAVPLGEMRSVVCASPAYLQERTAPRTPEQLSSHDCVTFAALAGVDTWMFRNKQSVHVRSRLTVNTAEAAIDAAIAGTGLTRVLAYQAAPAIQAGQLAIVLEAFEPQALPVNLLYVKEARLTAKLRRYLDFVTPRLREQLAGIESMLAWTVRD